MDDSMIRRPDDHNDLTIQQSADPKIRQPVDLTIRASDNLVIQQFDDPII